MNGFYFNFFIGNHFVIETYDVAGSNCYLSPNNHSVKLAFIISQHFISAQSLRMKLYLY